MQSNHNVIKDKNLTLKISVKFWDIMAVLKLSQFTIHISLELKKLEEKTADFVLFVICLLLFFKKLRMIF